MQTPESANITNCPCETATPARTAAPFPRLVGWPSTLSVTGPLTVHARAAPAVLSSLPSSEMMISPLSFCSARNCAAACTSSAILCASLNAGMTIDNSGARSREGASTSLIVGQSRAHARDVARDRPALARPPSEQTVPVEDRADQQQQRAVTMHAQQRDLTLGSEPRHHPQHGGQDR